MPGSLPPIVGPPTVMLALGRLPVSDRWCELLRSRGLPVVRLSSETQLADALRGRHNAIVMIGSSLDPVSNGLAPARLVRRVAPSVAVVLVVSHSREEIVLEALRAGVADYLREPCSEAEFVACIDRCARLMAVEPGIATGRIADAGRQPMIGTSRAIRDVRTYLDRVAPSDANVLITGETGVGKELVARLIHDGSCRQRRPYVVVNCAAIPETLLESELFGVERGAFTGAHAARDGALKSADGGTLFLDEVGDMCLPEQAKILRAIEAKEVHPLGGRRRVPLDVRIVAATNQDLEALVAGNRFRKDLFYRLNVARIHLPPLRERKEDLVALADYFIRHFNARFHRDVEGFTPEALEWLGKYDWPGNVRELKNLVEAIFINLNGSRIGYIDLPDFFRRALERTSSLTPSEREQMLSALFATNWNKSRAAHELHWSRMTLYRKLAKYGVGDGDPSRRKA